MKLNVILLLSVLVYLPSPVHAQPDNRQLLQRLAQGDRQVVPALVKQGDAVIPELAKLLRSSQREEKALIISVIAEIAEQVGGKAKEAAPALAEALVTRDRAAASAAVRALGAIGPPAVSEVLKSLKGVANQPEALYPVRALGAIGTADKDTVLAVLGVLKGNPDPQVQIACIQAIGAAGPRGKEAVKQLLKMAEFDKKEGYYLVHVIVALGNIGPDAEEAIPFLTRTMKSAPAPHYRVHALEAIIKISPGSPRLNAFLEAFAEALASPDLAIAVLEIVSKNESFSKDKKMLKHVEELLRNKDARVRLHAALVFGKSNPDHPAVVSILIESLADRDAKMRRRTADAIGVMRPSDEAVIEALNQRMSDNDPDVRKAVTEALAKYKKK
jgi:HEAT repeat protein